MDIDLWNSTIRFSPKQVETLQTYILEHLAKCPDGSQSVSYLVSCIRMDTRLRFPTMMVDAESCFEALGFTLKRVYSKKHPSCIRRTDVTL
jgi:hypothetical protein